MFCKNCGREITDDSTFCTFCGAPVASAASCGASGATAHETLQLDPHHVQDVNAQVANSAYAGSDAGDPTQLGAWASPSAASSHYAPSPQATPAPAPQSAAPTSSLNKSALEIALVAGVALVAIVTVLVVMRPWDRTKMSPRTAREDATQQAETLATPSQDDSMPEPGVSASTPDANEPQVNIPVEQAPVATQTSESAPASVPVRDSLAAYSWAELSQLATQMEACATAGEAMDIAREHKLVGANGAFPRTTKDLRLTDGTTVSFRLVDIWHDEADTPCGRAGMSFLATSIGYERQMAPGTTTPGGWAAAPLRAWLQSDVWAALPQELREGIVPVYKWSNNEGWARSTSCVSQTYDTLWLPSIVELAGPVSWSYHTDPANGDLYNAVFNAEGYQYAAFQQEGIVDDDANGVLALSTGWWLRSTAASTGRGRHVSPIGDPSDFGDSSDAWGVVFGFCL